MSRGMRALDCIACAVLAEQWKWSPSFRGLMREAGSSRTAVGGPAGMRVPSDSTTAWVDAVAHLIDNPALRRSLAWTAQSEVCKNGSLQSQLPRYHALFSSFLDSSRGAAPAPAPTDERIPAVLILDPEGDAQKTQHSLRLHAEGPHRHHMAVVVTTQPGALPAWTEDLRYLQSTPSEFPGAAEQVWRHEEFDWKVITEAGAPQRFAIAS